MWRDTRDPNFVFDLSSLVLAKLPLPIDILRDYTLEFEIRVKRALMGLIECLWESISDRDCCWKLTDTLIKDIEEMNDAHESKLATLRVKLHRRGLAPPGIEVECIQLRS